MECPPRRFLVSNRISFFVASILTCLIVSGCSAGAKNERGEENQGEGRKTNNPSAEEQARALEDLRPPKRTRPLVAVLADNRGTETTDFLVPYGVLAESGVVDIVAVAPDATPIQLMPALVVMPQQTTEDFDRENPEGADYVIVPAMHRSDTPRVLAWIRSQAATGATIVGICSGAKVVANAGLLAGRAATTHWFDLDALEKEHPTLNRVNDRRYVVDRGVVTTTGVSASVPISLAMVEAIAGRPSAAELAKRIGARSTWTAAHNSKAFQLTGRSVRLALGNWIAFWRHETIGISIDSGVDVIALAFAADAFSRTYQSKAVTLADRGGIVRSKRGLELVPDRPRDSPHVDHLLSLDPAAPPARSLDATLNEIALRYGQDVASLVALQLEYPGDPAPAEG